MSSSYIVPLYSKDQGTRSRRKARWLKWKQIWCTQKMGAQETEGKLNEMKKIWPNPRGRDLAVQRGVHTLCYIVDLWGPIFFILSFFFLDRLNTAKLCILIRSNCEAHCAHCSHLHEALCSNCSYLHEAHSAHCSHLHETHCDQL